MIPRKGHARDSASFSAGAIRSHKINPAKIAIVVTEIGSSIMSIGVGIALPHKGQVN
jgi:hypothetical protein